jgi:hypothetical protein
LNKSYNILICPLEWGLGHAARMIPLASRLRIMNNRVFIGAGEKHLALFRNEIPGLTCLSFPGFSPGYSRWLPQFLALLLKMPLLLYHIIREHYGLKKIIRENAIDIIISDNRFGLWNKKARTVYVTHMPVIPLPKPLHFLEFIGIMLHRAVIKRYDFCFIPDLPGDLNVSGRLSHGISLPGNVRYIGLLSRFTEIRADENKDPAGFPHNTIILSGPEPQRSILYQKLFEVIKDKEPFTVILGGQPDKNTGMESINNTIFYNHLPAAEMKAVISGSKNIITRSGYTVIMELISLNCSALLIPTPGQTEQEYLATYLQEKGWFAFIPQNKINEGLPIQPVQPAWTNEIMEQSKLLLEKALKELTEKE